MATRTRTNEDRSAPEQDDLNGAHLPRGIDSTKPVTAEREARNNGTTGITLRIPLPHLSMPNVGDIDAKRMLWYGGLGAMATIGILDWPVALVVGTGTVIAARSRRAPTAPVTSRRAN
jgi:hypothetical protein